MVQYGKFVLDDLFSITGTKSTDAGKVSFVKNGDAQFVGRTSAGYGIQGMVNSADMGFDPNEANTISVSQVGTIVAQYRDFPYYTSQNITKFSADFLNPEVGLYFCGIINDWLGKAGFVGYHTVKQRDLKKQVVLLPVTSAGDPDFEYMTARIRELEAERIRELEAYLRVTGLGDTTLSASEAQALTKTVKLKKFKIGDMFDIRKGRRLTKANQLSGNTPFIGSSATDHGVTGHIGQDPIFEGRTLTVSYNGSVGQVFYQTDPYWASDDINVLSLKNKDVELTPEIGNYLATCLTMAGKGFGYNRKWNVARMTETAIELPVTADDDIDFDYMQNYIRATEKQTIKGVVEYKNRVIAETKNVVNG